jgi:hypothetical protein
VPPSRNSAYQEDSEGPKGAFVSLFIESLSARSAGNRERDAHTNKPSCGSSQQSVMERTMNLVRILSDAHAVEQEGEHPGSIFVLQTVIAH